MLLVNSKILSPFSKVLMNSLLCAKDFTMHSKYNQEQNTVLTFKIQILEKRLVDKQMTTVMHLK